MTLLYIREKMKIVFKSDLVEGICNNFFNTQHNTNVCAYLSGLSYDIITWITKFVKVWIRNMMRMKNKNFKNELVALKIS